MYSKRFIIPKRRPVLVRVVDSALPVVVDCLKEEGFKDPKKFRWQDHVGSEKRKLRQYSEDFNKYEIIENP